MQSAEKRINNEIQRIEIYKKMKKFPSNWFYLGPIIENGLPNNNIFMFSWKGNAGHLQGGVYTAKIMLQGDLTNHAPKVYMEDKFCHMHVYGHGLVCFPFIDQYKWKSSITLFEVAQELEKMLDSPPDITSPANEKMRQLFDKDPEDYYKYLQEQSKKFAANTPYSL